MLSEEVFYLHHSASAIDYRLDFIYGFVTQLNEIFIKHFNVSQGEQNYKYLMKNYLASLRIFVCWLILTTSIVEYPFAGQRSLK
nr:hypothetical transcript [Hymenolepis microstoma]